MALWQPRGSRHQHGPKAHDGQMGPVPPSPPGIPPAPGSAASHLIMPLTTPIASHACPMVKHLPRGHGGGTPPSPNVWESLDRAVGRVLQESPRCMDISGCVDDPHSRWDPSRYAGPPGLRGLPSRRRTSGYVGTPKVHSPPRAQRTPMAVPPRYMTPGMCGPPQGI